MGAATATTTATTAAASTATARFCDFFGAWHVAEFQGHADVFADFLLNHLQFLLCGEEVAGDFIIKQSFAGGFKFADFSRAEFNACVLFLMQFLTPFVDALVLKAGGIVVEETFDACLEFEKRGVICDVSAKFPGFFNQGGVLSNNGHVGWLYKHPEFGNGLL